MSPQNAVTHAAHQVFINGPFRAGVQCHVRLAAERAQGIQVGPLLTPQLLAQLWSLRAEGALQPKSIERWEPGLILVRLGILARQAAVSSVQGYQLVQQGRALRLDGLCQVIVEPRARAGGPCRLPSSLEKATDSIQAASSGKALRS